jgi:hypothetical protein
MLKMAVFSMSIKTGFMLILNIFESDACMKKQWAEKYAKSKPQNLIL